ncbi:hypothetical protein Goklo_004901 [Gossypium klotzschianum]|nr:hypothetical protein [Gossypium klotzschianum]
MVVYMAPMSGISWKDKLLRGRGTRSLDSSMISDDFIDVDLEFEEGDILRSIFNGIPTIDFSERIKKVLVKDIVKIFGCNIWCNNLFFSGVGNSSFGTTNPTSKFV